MINSELASHLKTKNECLELISDIAVDYDGCRTVESIMTLIDELKSIAAHGLAIKE